MIEGKRQGEQGGGGAVCTNAHHGESTRAAHGLIAAGSFAALAGVALGAFGAHGLRGTLASPMMAIYETAVQYHLVHALALLALGLAGPHRMPPGLVRGAAWAMLAGIVLFSGSLYLLAVSGAGWLAMVTPFGGAAWLLAWLLLGVAALRARR